MDVKIKVFEFNFYQHSTLRNFFVGFFFSIFCSNLKIYFIALRVSKAFQKSLHLLSEKSTDNFIATSKDKGSLPATCWVLSGTFYQAFYQAVYCKNTYLGKKTITFLQKLLTTKMIMLTRASRACNSIYTDNHL